MNSAYSSTPLSTKNIAKKRVIVIGNCVAERLQYLLPDYPDFIDNYELVPSPMVHLLRDPKEWQELAEKTLACDIILTQPLFNYGPCNTANLKAALQNGQRLAVFSSPQFDAYFPDVASFIKKGPFRVTPPLEWDSLIIFSCYLAGVSIFEVEDIYYNHYLFSKDEIQKNIVKSLERYAQREGGLDFSTSLFTVRNYAKTKLFHSPRHPVDDFLQGMLGQLATFLQLNTDTFIPIDGFGFNQWPVITRRHNLFSFEEQAYFIIGGKRFSIEDAAMAYYNFYKFNPQVVEANRHKAITL